MKIRYVGPHDEVEIAATRQRVERGQTVEVPSTLGNKLVKQATWKKVESTPKKEDEET